MNYEPVSEKTPVTPMQMSDPLNKSDHRQNSDIRRTRIALLVFLIIEGILLLANFIQRIVALVQHYQLPENVRDPKLGGSLIGNTITAGLSLLYIILFLIFVIKYVRIGILIFAWLGLIQLILIVIFLVLAIIGIVAVSAVLHGAGAGLIISIIVVVIAGIACLLTILIVVFAFKLAKLLKMHGAYQFV